MPTPDPTTPYAELVRAVTMAAAGWAGAVRHHREHGGGEEVVRRYEDELLTAVNALCGKPQ